MLLLTVLCVLLCLTPSCSTQDLLATLPVGSQAIPLDSLFSLGSSSKRQCCEIVPGICDASGVCYLEHDVCEKACRCVTELPIHMCEHMIPDTSTSSDTSTNTDISSSHVSGASSHNTTTSSELNPSIVVTSSSPTIGDDAGTTPATPILTSIPETVTSPSNRLPTINTDLIHPSKSASITSISSGEITTNDKNATGTNVPLTDAVVSEASSNTSASNTSEDDSDQDYPGFIPPSMGSVSACANCSGVCVMSWVALPMFECVEEEDYKCSNFKCGENGRCVEDGSGHVSCECNANYTGTFCDHVCDLDCGDMGECAFLNNTMHCVCKWNYTGEGCSDIRTTPAPLVKEIRVERSGQPWTVVGICAGVSLLLCLLTLGLPYWMWRRRWLPMRRLVHYFQHYEDDDGKEFDAFISYKSTKRDEDFVVHQLYPKLEKELDFKLCMHFRDFPPGASIAENIINAIESSRRTIMILSPSYVESEWCRLEYQKAQHEMLKRKHRIIPILLDDISGVIDMDTNLKDIVNTVTYISWPGEENSKKLDRFWKLMECALPKKRHDSLQSISSGNGSSSSDVPLTSISPSLYPETLSDDVFTEKKDCFSYCNEIDLVDESYESTKICESDTVVSLPRDINTKSTSDKPKSDDHIIEIIKLPGNNVKVLPHIRKDFRSSKPLSLTTNLKLCTSDESVEDNIEETTIPKML